MIKKLAQFQVQNAGNRIYRLVRRHVKANAILYGVVAKNAKDEAVIANLNTEIIIEGFQRSGNTFAWLLVKQLFSDDLRIGHHTHAVANLKIGLKHNIPTVIIVRSPLDALVSASLYRIHEEDNVDRLRFILQLLIDDYSNFHYYLLKNIHSSCLLIHTFDDLVTDPEGFCDAICDSFEQRLPAEITRNIEAENLYQVHKDYEARKHVPLHRTTQKNGKKDEMKPARKRFIMEQFPKKLTELNYLYEGIINELS